MCLFRYCKTVVSSFHKKNTERMELCISKAYVLKTFFSEHFQSLFHAQLFYFTLLFAPFLLPPKGRPAKTNFLKQTKYEIFGFRFKVEECEKLQKTRQNSKAQVAKEWISDPNFPQYVFNLKARIPPTYAYHHCILYECL